MTEEVFIKRQYWFDVNHLKEKLYLNGRIQSIEIENAKLYIVTHDNTSTLSRKEQEELENSNN